MIKDLRQILAVIIMFIYSSNFRLRSTVDNILNYSFETRLLGVFVLALVFFWGIEGGFITGRHLSLALGATGIMTIILSNEVWYWENK